MESNVASPPPDSSETKAEFRKLSNDAANRKYRRRSPGSPSSSADGSPKHPRSPSPAFARGRPDKVSELQYRRRDNERDLERDSGRSHSGRAGDSYRHYDRSSTRSSHGHSRHRDHTRDVEKNPLCNKDSSGHRSRDREKDDMSLEHSKYKERGLSSDRAGTGGKRSNLASEDKERDRYKRDRDGRDERRDYHRSSGDHNSDRPRYHGESRGHRTESSGRDKDGYRSRDYYNDDERELDGQKEKQQHNDRVPNRDADGYGRSRREHIENKSIFGMNDQDSPSKKPKKLESESDTDQNGNAVGDGKQLSNSKKTEEIDLKSSGGQAQANSSDFTNDFNAARIAAMKAAESVNRNLVGVGIMSTEQKKKLLWGNKNNTASEEGGPKWNTSLVGDRDRQEKFNKLLSLRLPWYLWPIVGCEGSRENGLQPRKARWERSSGSREAEGTPDGSREAIYCWASAKRWPYCRSRTLSLCLMSFCCQIRILFCMFLCSWSNWAPVTSYPI